MAAIPEEEHDFTDPKFTVALFMNAGCSGADEGVLSLHNIEATSDIVGRIAADSWTHSSPIWMHLETSLTSYDSPNDASTISKGFPCSHRSQTYKRSIMSIMPTNTINISTHFWCVYVCTKEN